MAEEWLERLKHAANHGGSMLFIKREDLRALINAYEERGKVLEEIGEALEWMIAIAENNPGIQIERIGNKARALRAHLNKDTPNG